MIPSSLLMTLGFGLGPPPPPLAPEGIRSPLPRRSVQVQGLRVATAEAGEGPPVVLLHGLSSYAAFWEPVLPALLRAGRRVLIPDLPGFGASDKPDAPYTPPWYAALVADWMGALGVERAPVLGHSMGGQIALTLALRHPERVERLALSAPAGIETFEPRAADFMRRFWHPERALHAQPAEVAANFLQLAYARDTPEVRRLLTERLGLQQHPDFAAVSRAVSRCVAGMLDHPVAAELHRLELPVAIAWGAMDRMIPNPVFTRGGPQDLVRLSRAVLPRARVRVVEGAGHFVHADEPDAFWAAVGW